MTQAEQMKGLLEHVGLEIVNHPKMIEWNYRVAIRDVLERRLLPLLEAGQAMRDTWPIGNVSYHDEPKSWDAALAAAKERQT